MDNHGKKTKFLSWQFNDLLETHPLGDDPIIIGRQEDCQVVLDLPGVSRTHVTIFRDGDHYYLEDLDSSMGTRLNEHLLGAGEKKALTPGDKIFIGKAVLFFGREAGSPKEQNHLDIDVRFSTLKLTEEVERFRQETHTLIDTHVGRSGQAALIKAGIEEPLGALKTYAHSKLEEYRVLQEITQILVRILDVKELLSTALHLVSEVLNADRGFIILYDPKHGSLRSMIPRHFDRGQVLDYDLSFSQTIAKNCYESKEIIIIEDALKDERFSSSQSIVASSIRSVICIPLQHGKTISGVIYLDNLKQPNVFHEHQADFLRTFSGQTAIALENARLYTQAVTDGLTRLYNRKFMDERVFEEMVRSRRYERNCSLIILDIDHFKVINDNHGHHFGDLVLELVANVLRENARSSDVVGRYGGEEFLMLLTETNESGAHIFAERLRAAVESLVLTHGKTTLNVTVSCGVAGYQPEYRNDVVTFVKCADKGLYRAKETGRNRVCGSDD